MSSKEMLEHLAEMKIPAKSASAALEDAYISMIRKNLAPILEQRAAAIEAERAAEQEAARKAAEEAERAAEQERIEAEKRREEERRIEAERRAAAEACASPLEEAERARIEAERKAEEEKRRPRDTAPKSTPSFSSLLEQIAQQERMMAAAKEEKAATKAAEKAAALAPKDKGARKGERGQAQQQGSGRRGGNAAAAQTSEAKLAGGPQGRFGAQAVATAEPVAAGEDRYAKMAREAEEYNRDRVLAEARAAVQEASREQGGRRKKRKERREQAAEEARHQEAIEAATANDQNPADLDVVKIGEGTTVAEFADLLGVPANDIIKRLFLLGSPLTMTQPMSNELIELIADDLGRRVRTGD